MKREMSATVARVRLVKRALLAFLVCACAFGCASTATTLRGYEEYKSSNLPQLRSAKEIELEVIEDAYQLGLQLRNALSQHFSLTSEARYRVVVKYGVNELYEYRGQKPESTGIIRAWAVPYIVDKGAKQIRRLTAAEFSNDPKITSANPEIIFADNPLQALTDAITSEIVLSSR